MQSRPISHKDQISSINCNINLLQRDILLTHPLPHHVYTPSPPSCNCATPPHYPPNKNTLFAIANGPFFFS